MCNIALLFENAAKLLAANGSMVAILEGLYVHFTTGSRGQILIQDHLSRYDGFHHKNKTGVKPQYL